MRYITQFSGDDSKRLVPSRHHLHQSFVRIGHAKAVVLSMKPWVQNKGGIVVVGKKGSCGGQRAPSILLYFSFHSRIGRSDHQGRCQAQTRQKDAVEIRT